MPTRDDVVTELAVLTALEGRIKRAKDAAKAKLADELPRGTVYAYDGIDTSDEHVLGYASVPRPAKPKPVVTIDDLARVLPWALDEFGDSAVAFTLTEQGRTSVTAYVLAQHAAAGSPKQFELEGVLVEVPDPKPSTPRFVPSKQLDQLVESMVRDGRLNLAEVANLGALNPAN